MRLKEIRTGGIVMRLKTLKLSNFRGYKNETVIEFDNLTTFVGKNDIGKSSILEALDIFFNDGKAVIKLDKDDINKQEEAEGNREIVISVCFDELPESIIIDATNSTTLQAEYMLNEDGNLEIIKKYANAGTAKVFIKAHHPTNQNCYDLLGKKDTELRALIDRNGIECADRTRKAAMRQSIWSHYQEDLALQSVELDVKVGETKTIWDKLQQYIPIYNLFQSDRKNSDSDNEVQDPLKQAVKEILNDETLRLELNSIAIRVQEHLEQVSSRTLEKLREMDEAVADSLSPVIPPLDSLKWIDVFKSVSIAGDGNIPINKRGSGVKRLILLSFFRAEAERRSAESGNTSVIYAIEEPETSQHTENQRLLINAFRELSESVNTQVILTTHSANIVKELTYANLRLIANNDGIKSVSQIIPGELPYTSLNEVNYLAFSEISEEYHNELYGYIEAEGKLGEYKIGKYTIPYIRELRGGGTKEEELILTEFVRNQIHHPENTRNRRFSQQQLRESIEQMRDFIREM